MVSLASGLRARLSDLLVQADAEDAGHRDDIAFPDLRVRDRRSGHGSREG